MKVVEVRFDYNKIVFDIMWLINLRRENMKFREFEFFGFYYIFNCNKRFLI